jgi:hypothetical protein
MKTQFNRRSDRTGYMIAKEPDVTDWILKVAMDKAFREFINWDLINDPPKIAGRGIGIVAVEIPLIFSSLGSLREYSPPQIMLAGWPSPYQLIVYGLSLQNDDSMHARHIWC